MQQNSKFEKLSPHETDSVLNDFKREQDEKTAMNKPPIVDVPRNRSVAGDNLSRAIGARMRSKKSKTNIM